MSWYRTDNYFTSKNGRLHIYKTKMKYKGKYKSENWYGRTFVDKKQLTKSSTTTNKKAAKEILDNWDRNKYLFWQIIPKEMVNKFEEPVLVETTKTA